MTQTVAEQISKKISGFVGAKPLLFAISFLALLPAASAHFTTYTDEWDYNPEYYTVLSFSPDEPPVEDRRELLTVNILNATSGNPIPGLDIAHERVMHVFIIGEDLRTFDHIHPEDYPQGLANSHLGMYWMTYSFPKAGRYAILIDYTVNGTQVIKKFNINASGQDFLARPQLDLSREKTFGEYKVELRAPESIEAGEEVNLDYYITKDGKEVRDLQMYLGSEIHAVVIRDDLKLASHTHAYVPGHSRHFGNMSQRYYGPTVPVRYTFPGTGKYTIFGQFRHEGKIITTSFDVEVKTSRTLLIIYVAYYGGAVALALYLFWPYLSRLARRILYLAAKKRLAHKPG